jgi:hypothetical protein
MMQLKTFALYAVLVGSTAAQNTTNTPQPYGTFDDNAI